MTFRLASAWRSILWAAVVAIVVAAGCADGSGSGDAPVEPAPVDYGRRGPFTVGTTTLEMDNGLVDVFYPAASDADGPDLRYSTQEPLDDDLQELIPPDLNVPIEVDAMVDTAPSDAGPFPLVLHSHGFGSYRRFSATHLAHLASWGLVAAAPDHLERDLAVAVGGVTDDLDPDVDVEMLAATLDGLTRETIERGGDLEGVIDTEQVGVEGHSAGGAAALEFGTNPQVDVVIGQAPSPPVAFAGPGRAAPTAELLSEVEPPDKPVMLIAADGDVSIDLAADIEPIYDWLTGEKELAVLDDTGHSVFIDSCQTFWERGGLLGLLEEIDIAIGEDVSTVANDGCDPNDDVEPSSLWPVIDHLSVARYLSILGPDRASARLSLTSEFLAETFGDSIAEFRSE